ncbi:FtsK/SpoIIIE domain-containing protein [Acetobacter persici]|uniref:ATP-binding protein n=1 Tax=Acetobacter persici TaxID=1076596 RepID=A0A6V8IAV1_9PROT|nr:FtsK/SpoIIIE domain-containing protein [Acetobacter persici]OUI91011.1 cell division protein FtsK [Acetobacter persici]GFE94711.1 ATP-binding protein [Acetobacter persici]
MVIAKLHKAIVHYQEGLMRIDREFTSTKRAVSEDQERNWSIRKSNWQAYFSKEWEKNVNAITKVSSRLRQHQRAFVDFSLDQPLMVSEIPSGLVLGSQQFSFEQFSCNVPQVIPFPFTSAFTFSQDDAEQRQYAHCLLLRLLSALPPSQVELILIDPLQQGQSVEPFLPLLKVKQIVPQGHVLTRADEIEAVLGKLTDEIEEMIQKRFNKKVPNWLEYNATNTDTSFPYKVGMIFDVPEQISEKSSWFLGRICENGPRCGVLPIIAIDEQNMEGRRYEKFSTTIKKLTTQLTELLLCTPSGDLSCTYFPEQWPRPDLLDSFIERFVRDCATNTRFKKTMPDLWVDFVKGETTLNGFDIPIGWTPSGDFVNLRLGATNSGHHVLLAGKTGSGKSNLLHVLIHTLCEKYSPEELDLYLLDYKESTEFNIYATPPVPHARLVATESDPEYGVTVLRHLVEELETRSRLFKSKNAKDFEEYRKLSGIQLPRVLLVIDEFQVLFSESRQVAEAVEQLLSMFLKQGRSFGIHILLATQTLKGINAQSIGSIITQMGCRIALACGQEDSAVILGSGNWAAAKLCSPPEGIINNANGDKSDNVKFMIPFAGESDCRRELLTELIKRTCSSGSIVKAKVFSGAFPPEMPLYSECRLACAQEEALLLGESLTFFAKLLTVPLIRRSAFNVLFSGYNDDIHDGLLAAMLYSLAFTGSFNEIVYFNARGVSLGGVSSAVQELGARFKMFDDISELPLQAILDDIGTRRIALIVDGLDSEKALQSATTFRLPKPGEPPTPADLLKCIAEDGPRKGTFVFTFVDRWQRCGSICKELFSFFELRVAYCMNEDDAGSLVSGGIGKLKGIEKPNRAVFVNKMTNEITWFRPYIQESTR